MPDRENVIKWLKEISLRPCDFTTEDFDATQTEHLADDALALLREQEPVEPKEEQYKIVCGVCSEKLVEICGDVDVVWNDDAKYPKFCPECGRAVKWDA